ncbi:hypothetical protein L6452_05792 [Arctium lappa]|uniref:Uncharacterized protein n=1 Tax=Arctium lappa TaxID=4217 RepID=A0ACB9EI26_ARCLA|nr:hypothetical protein L6452_05792 [Arctium lappa]
MVASVGTRVGQLNWYGRTVVPREIGHISCLLNLKSIAFASKHFMAAMISEKQPGEKANLDCAGGIVVPAGSART